MGRGGISREIKKGGIKKVECHLYGVSTTTFNGLLCQKGQFTHQPCARRWVVRKIFGYYPLFIEMFACPKRIFSGNWGQGRGGGS